jgi:hypothetical protein
LLKYRVIILALPFASHPSNIHLNGKRVDGILSLRFFGWILTECPNGPPRQGGPKNGESDSSSHGIPPQVMPPSGIEPEIIS